MKKTDEETWRKSGERGLKETAKTMRKDEEVSTKMRKKNKDCFAKRKEKESVFNEKEKLWRGMELNENNEKRWKEFNEWRRADYDGFTKKRGEINSGDLTKVRRKDVESLSKEWRWCFNKGKKEKVKVGVWRGCWRDNGGVNVTNVLVKGEGGGIVKVWRKRWFRKGKKGRNWKTWTRKFNESLKVKTGSGNVK